MVNNRHQKTLSAIFARPSRAGLRWPDIEVLVVALGGEVTEGEGSRVRLALNGVRAVFHRPHPRPETDKGAITSLRRFFEAAGVKP